MQFRGHSYEQGIVSSIFEMCMSLRNEQVQVLCHAYRIKENLVMRVLRKKRKRNLGSYFPEDE